MRTLIATGTLGGNVPRRCFVCRRWVWVEPSDPVGDAPCPCCGTLLWPWHGRAHRSAAALLQHPARRLGAALRKAWRRVRAPRHAARAGARTAKTPSSAPAPGAQPTGVWDAWLDG